MEQELVNICCKCKKEVDNSKLKKEFFINHEYLSGKCDHCDYELFIRVN